MIKIESVTKAFRNRLILRDLNLEVKQNEILALLGPNGCGKTTLLNIISGLALPDAGNITIAGVLVDGTLNSKLIHLPPYARKVGYVFQTASLFPHMRVRDNVSFGLKAKHLSKREIELRTRLLLDFVNMREYAEYYPHQLSGGQKQRIALARSLATDPQVLLLDEPMSAVDAKSRESLRVEFRKLLRSLKITAIYVTHNLTEALMMSDKIAVMGNGKIEQIGTRAEILDKPNSMYVAEFLGINAYIAKVVTDVSGNFQVKIGDVAISFPQLTTFTEQSLMVTLKPEDVQLMPMQEKEKLCSSNAESIRLKGVVTEINLMRSIAKITVDVGFPIKSELTLSALEGLALSEGDNICVQLKTEALNISPVS